MVITIHINAGGTGQVLQHATKTPWKWIVSIVTILCYPAVNTYILITGYYSYDAHKDSRSVIRSLTLLWLSAAFFSLIGYLASVTMFDEHFQIIELVKRFFPIIRGVWWFYTVYFALMLLSPFINKMIDSLSVAEHKLLLSVLIIMLSILPIFVDWKGKLGSNDGYSLIWFITLYITGAYLKKKAFLVGNRRWGMFGGIAYIVSSMIIYIFPKVLSLIGIQSTLAIYNSLFVYIQAISLFVMFGNLRIPDCMKKAVASISALALASYLLHCQEDIEKLLWSKVHPSSYANSIEIVFVALVIICSVFCISLLLELLRKKLCKILHIDKKFVCLTDNVFIWCENVLKIERN